MKAKISLVISGLFYLIFTATLSAQTGIEEKQVFFDKGKTPTSIVFDVYEVDNQYLNTKRTYDEQYDNFYNYGIENLNSKFYNENFSFL